MRNEYVNLVEQTILMELVVQSLPKDLSKFINKIDELIGEERFIEIMKKGFSGTRPYDYADDSLIKILDIIKRHMQDTHENEQGEFDGFEARDIKTAIQFYTQIVKSIIENVAKLKDIPEELQGNAKKIVALMTILSDFESSNNNLDQLLVIPKGDLRAAFDRKKENDTEFKIEIKKYKDAIIKVVMSNAPKVKIAS